MLLSWFSFGWREQIFGGGNRFLPLRIKEKYKPTVGFWVTLPRKSRIQEATRKSRKLTTCSFSVPGSSVLQFSVLYFGYLPIFYNSYAFYRIYSFIPLFFKKKILFFSNLYNQFWARTHNPNIQSPMFCKLSWSGTFFFFFLLTFFFVLLPSSVFLGLNLISLAHLNHLMVNY